MIDWEYVGKQKLLIPDGGFLADDAARVHLWRAKVPGGWLLMTAKRVAGQEDSGQVSFYGDPKHEWDGDSI